MKLNRVVLAKSIIPANNSCGMVCTVIIPMSSTHDMMLDENCTIGTSAERILSGAYAFACCNACPHSCAATAAAAMLAE